MKITGYRTLSKSNTVYILKQIREFFNFPIGWLLEVQATDETEDGKLIIMIRKVEGMEGKRK